MKKSLSGLLIVASLVLSGCSMFKYRADYIMGMTDAERDNTLVTQNINKDMNSHYEDDLVSFDFELGEHDLNFVLKNKTNNTIKLIWDESLFIDADGASHKVFHSGIKFTDREASMPPSLIIKGGKLTDLIAPTDYAYFESGRYGGWEQLPILAGLDLDKVATEANHAKIVEHVNKVKGMNLFKALFTLEIEGVKKPYIFSFGIHDAMVKEIK